MTHEEKGTGRRRENQAQAQFKVAVLNVMGKVNCSSDCPALDKEQSLPEALAPTEQIQEHYW